MCKHTYQGHLSGHVLCLNSTVCPFFLLNAFLVLFLGEGLFIWCACVYGGLVPAVGQGPWCQGLEIPEELKTATRREQGQHPCVHGAACGASTGVKVGECQQAWSWKSW